MTDVALSWIALGLASFGLYVAIIRAAMKAEDPEKVGEIIAKQAGKLQVLSE